MMQAGYRKSYRVPVLVELAHVKERDHEKHVLQAEKFAKYLLVGTAVPRSGHAAPMYLSTALYLYLTPRSSIH